MINKVYNKPGELSLYVKQSARRP